jgi:hypothetical protein
MKKYRKRYYFDNGDRVEIILNDREFEEILKDIDKSINNNYTSEIFKDINKIFTINMDKVNCITVEEVENENN